ncbi:MAG: S49 family peptidase, partial [Mucilaginibacter sp.]
VWTGSQALKIGLVDKLGNIEDAVKTAAKMAKLKDYKLVSYPEQKGLLGNLGLGVSAKIKASMIQSELGDNYIYYKQINAVKSMMRTPQARMEYEVVVR